MSEWKKACVLPDTPILEVIDVVDKGGIRIALIVDNEMKLLGIVTDGDIRRCILKQVDLSTPVFRMMNKKPLVVSSVVSKQQVFSLMQSNAINHIPLCDFDRKVLDLYTLEEMVVPSVKENPVVIMAGGLGTRLRPLTETCPKPMLEVGGRPILETIIENFIEAGYKTFYVTLNYKGAMIEEYFGDGASRGAEIHYIKEEKRLGTAGALSLLPEVSQPIIVMNGDILTKIDFDSLMHFHLEKRAELTASIREHHFQIPYGVVDMDHEHIMQITEKPTEKVFVNGGIYVINPAVIDEIPRNAYMDIPVLIQRLLMQKRSVCGFPIREYWKDIGHLEEFSCAEEEFQEVFQ